MIRCDHCQSLLLEHLYGLLDPAEAAVVESHLAGCSGCTVARDQAARMQELFGRAGKVEFPNFRFEPPASYPPAPALPSASSPTVPPVEPAVPSSLTKRHPTRPTAWVGWAVAAGVLALAAGVVVPTTSWGRDYQTARDRATAAATRAADARATLDEAVGTLERHTAAARQRHDVLLAQWAAAERAATRAEADRKLTVEVVKPAALQPGAPNDFLVSVHGDDATDYRVEAEVRDEASNVFKLQPLPGEPAPLRLPAEVWTRVGPRSELFLTVSAVNTKTGERKNLLDPVRLFGPVYATMLATDRPVYRPGERVHFRSLTLDRVTFRPPGREQVLRYDLRKVIPNPAPGEPVAPAVPGTERSGRTGLVHVVGDAVEPVRGPDGQPVRGVGCGSFALPIDLPEGDYVLTLTEEAGPGGLPPLIHFPVTRTIQVRSGAVEQYAKKVGFARASYAPGDLVEAWVEVQSQGKPVPGIAIAAAATADGSTLAVPALDGTTDGTGRARIRFRLPPGANLPRGDVRLKVTVLPPNGQAEAVAERVPVSGRGVVVEFFPEGGKLVAGVPCRVYVRATTPHGRSVELKGTVTDGRELVARVETVNDPAQPAANRGLGVFTLVPKPGVEYWLTLEQPAGTAPAIPGPVREAPAAVLGPAAALAFRSGFLLPVVETDGVVMTVLDPVTRPGEPIRVRLQSPGKARNLLVGAYIRGRLADTQRVATMPGTPVEVQLLAGDDLRGGVTRITVFEDLGAGGDLKAVAERLVFRRPGESLSLSFDRDATQVRPVVPGESVELNVTATDEQGRPVPAVLWAAVTNAALTAGPKDRLLPTHFLLSGEVHTPDQLEHADFLLTDHPKAAQTLDLVLATQGWRRFAEQNPPRAAPLRRPPGAAPVGRPTDRVVAANGQYPVLLDPSPARQEHRKLAEKYWPMYAAAARELDAAEQARANLPATERELVNRYNLSEREVVERVAAVQTLAEPLATLYAWRWYAAGGTGVVALALAALAFLRPVVMLPMAISSLAGGGVSGYLLVGLTQPVTIPPLDLTGVPNVSIQEPATAPDGVGNGLTTVIREGVERVAPPAARTPQPRMFSGLPVGPHPVWQNPGALWQPGLETLRPDPELRQGVVPGPARPQPAAGAQPDDVLRKAEDYTTRQAAIANGKINALAEVKQAAGDPLEPEVLTRIRDTVPLDPPLVVREYAAPRPGADTVPAEVDTVLWQPVIVLPTEGKTTLRFTAGPAAGGYQVLVAGHTLDGRIGATQRVVPVAQSGKE
jgi:hypothetical protein